VFRCHRSGSLRQSGGNCGQPQSASSLLYQAALLPWTARPSSLAPFLSVSSGPSGEDWFRLLGTSARAQKGAGLGRETERNKSKVSHPTFVEAVGSLHSSASTLYILHRFVMSRIIRLFSTVVRLYNSQLYSVGGKKSGSVGALSLLMSFLSPPSFFLAT